MEKFKTKRGLILYFLKGAGRYFAVSALFALLVSLLDMISPKVISFAVDHVIGDAPIPDGSVWLVLTGAAGGLTQLRRYPLILAAVVAVIGIGAAFCRYVFRVSNAKGSETFVQRMRDTLYEHILRLPFSWFSAHSTGDIIQRCTSDVQTIKRFVSEQMVALVRTVILLIVSMTFMIRISMPAALLNAAFVPVVVGYSLFFHSRIGSAFKKADEEEGRLSAIAQENLTGVRVVRAFGRERYEKERFESQNTWYTGFWIHLYRLLSFFWVSGDVLTVLQSLSVTLLCTVLCVRDRMSAGDMIALLSYTVMLAWPIRMLGRVISEMSKAGISIDRLREIMNAQPETDRPGARKVPIDQEIRFAHVTFSYPNGEELLQDVSFSIPAGSTLGILGGTGSGKSTLVHLLERLYDLPEGCGKITIGGTDIRDIPLEHLRKNVGIVLQEPFLFSGTLEENIGICADHTEQTYQEQIRRAAHVAALSETIESFAAGYDTVVGERGVTLSGGQKQRTAIAQLVIRKTPVMIFDDSLSAVDSETDARIRRALREYEDSATVILIAHRITTLMHADNIIVLDRGRIAEQGTHAQLMSHDGMYRRIFELQAGAEREDGSPLHD